MALRAEVESLVAQAESTPSVLEVAGSTPPPSLVGRHLGAYRIDGLIGAGGMGEVYRAKDTRLGRDVAVKVLPAAFATDAERRARFEREARAVAALNHANICTIHDVGHDDGIEFLVMELVEGESLAARIARGPLPLEEAVARAIEIADALDGAHRQGIVHRDLKPGNVMLTRTGSGNTRAVQAKLLDFGLARIVPSGVRAGLSAVTEAGPMTEAGSVLGTLQYMAPEQIEGRLADTRADIFAFGALLYEMLTGRRAFEGASTAAVIAAVLREDPPPVNPPDVGRIVRRCLAKDPLRRYQSARDLLNDLEDIEATLESAPIETPTARATRRMSGSTVAWLMLSFLAGGIVSAAYFEWRRESALALLGGRFQLQPPAGVSVAPSQAWSVLAVSPDGQWVAFVGLDTTTNESPLYLRHMGDVAARRIAPGGYVPFFSPDSQWLGFFAGNGLFKISTKGESPQRICDVSSAAAVRGASWGDDGTILFTHDGSLWRVSAAEGIPRELARPTSPMRYYWPHVLPGSGAALFAIKDGYNDRWSRIAAVSLKTGDIRTFPAVSGTAPRYVPGGHVVFSRFGALHAAPFDLSRLEFTDDSRKVLDDVQHLPLSGSVAFDVSASGPLVYIPEADRIPKGEMFWLDRRGKAAPLPEDRRPYVDAALDPNAKRLAAVIADDLGEADVFVYDVARRSWTQLTRGLHAWSQLAWSPDGTWIFFTSFKSGNAELFRVPSRGGTAEQLTFDAKYWEYPTSVSPDGRTLLFWQTEPTQSALMLLKLEPRGTPEPLTNSRGIFEAAPSISPSGRWVAYVSNVSGSDQVHVRSFSGSGPGIRVSANAGTRTRPLWSRDGRELFFQRGSEIWAVAVEEGDTFAHREPRLLFKADFPERSDSYLASGPVGDRFVAVRREPPHHQLVYIPHWIAELRQALSQ